MGSQALTLLQKWRWWFPERHRGLGWGAGQWSSLRLEADKVHSRGARVRRISPANTRIIVDHE